MHLPLRRTLRSFWLRLAGLLVAGVLPVQAELTWLKTHLVLEPPAGAQVAVGQFQFLNHGPQSVHVTGVQSGCGCTAAVLDSENVPAGGQGGIQATFQTGERRGVQKVTLTVTTEEPQPRSYDLVLEVRLKDFATVTPQVQTWRVGEDVSPKIFRVTLADGFDFVGAESITAEFQVSAIRRVDRQVEITITPRDLWAKRAGTVQFKVRQPGQPTVEVTASLRVI